MRGWWKPTMAAGAVLLSLGAAPLSAQPPGYPPVCDQYDPYSPASSVRITLDSSDLVDSRGDGMRSFIETGSLGRVDAAIVASNPPGAVISMSAIPQISRYSPYYGEELKGIAVAVALGASRRPAHVVLDLRQVCARHFRNTFLYY